MAGDLNYRRGDILKTIISVAIGIYIVKKHNAGVIEMVFVMIASYIFLDIIGVIYF